MSGEKKEAYVRGLLAEIIAAVYLVFKGYKILSWRYKTPQGEIDLVVYDGNYLVFVEVKQRASIDDGLLSLTPHMQARISRAALHFIAEHRHYADMNMRFDFLAVKLPFSIHHLDNAWQSQ